MSKIVIVGGTSEIGNAIAKLLWESHPEEYKSILRLSTSLKDPDAINWDPQNMDGILEGLNKVKVTRNDAIIIALGSLGKFDSSSNREQSLRNINNIYQVNSIIPILVLDHFVNELEAIGGGRVILLTSTAAFPVLKNNFLYGSAKHVLDTYGKHLQNNDKIKKTTITIVRSGYVQTKLNDGRKPTPFSLTVEQVARLVVTQLDNQVIWTPKVFKYICFVLRHFWPLRTVADYLVGKSKK